LLFGVLGAGMVGVLLMGLYHRLAMRRERELHTKRQEALELHARAEQATKPASGARNERRAGKPTELDFHR
jgi:hypothetical protein